MWAGARQAKEGRLGKQNLDPSFPGRMGTGSVTMIGWCETEDNAEELSPGVDRDKGTP
jgi:hypothetical protein